MSVEPPAFQRGLEALEGHREFTDIPPPVNPLQAQTAFERRAAREDIVAHAIALIQTSGFFLLAFAALLGYVNLGNAATATFRHGLRGRQGRSDPHTLFSCARRQARRNRTANTSRSAK